MSQIAMEGVHASDLWDEGLTYAGPTTDPLGRVVKHELRLGRAESIAVLEKEYAFFTPALLYLSGTMSDQPLCDLMWELRRDVPIWFKKFRWPLFRGLESDGDSSWNHALWAVRRDDWDVFHDYYCSIAVRIAATGELVRVASQQVGIVDPLAVEKPRIVGVGAATCVVTAFGLNGTKAIVAYQQWPNPMTDPPQRRVYPPDESTKVFAAALATGENPHTAEAAYKERQRRKSRG